MCDGDQTCQDIYAPMSFKTLLAALTDLSSSHIVMAEDMSVSGQKCFLRGTVDTLDHKYNTLSAKHWYECLVETRPTRIFLDVESTTHVDVNDIVDVCKQAIRIKFQIDPVMEILDSCSREKYSWHVLCTNVYLKNVFHVGAFVRRLVLSMVGHPTRHAIDTAVYTRNRMFRVLDSSKFGSTRVLTHPSAKWSDLLVQAVGVSFQECHEIDESTPMSTSLHPDNMFALTDDGWTRTHHQNRRSAATAATSCPMIAPVLDWLDRHVGAQTCRHNMSLTSTGHYRVSTRSKMCAIARRTHKGNNIWFNIDLNRKIVYQRCYDEDCRSHAQPVAVPADQWSQWNRTWHELIHAPRNEKTLFNMAP
jgi:DNA-directed primase/polymerase protein